MRAWRTPDRQCHRRQECGSEAERLRKALREVLPGLGIDQTWRAFPLENVHELLGVPLRHEMARVHRDPGSMIGGDHIVEGQERVLQRRWLDIPDIDPGPGNLPGFQGRCQGSFLNDATAGRGNEKGIARHQGQFALANHAPGLGIVGTMDGDEIALCQERVELDRDGPTFLELGLREVRIIGEHAHVEPLPADPRHQPAHIAQPDDAHGAPLRVPALKPLAVNTALLPQGAVRLHDVLRQREHHGDCMLGHGLGIGARLIDYENARSRARCDIYRVVSSSRGGHHQQRWTARNERCRAFILVWHLVPRRGDAIGMALRHDRPGLGLWGMKGQTVDDEIRFVCQRIGNIRGLMIVEPEDTLLSGTSRH